MINRPAADRPQVTCWQPRGQMQPKSKGHARSQVPARRALSNSGRLRSRLPLGEPQSRPGGPGTRRTHPEPRVQGGGRVCRRSSRKNHLGTCLTLTCSQSPGPGEARSPASSESRPPPRRAAQGAGCVSESLGCDHGCERRRRQQRVPADQPERSLLAPTSSLGTAAGRASLARSRPGCCSAALGRPLVARSLLPPRCCLLLESVDSAPSLGYTRVKLPCPLAQFPASGSRKRTSFLA